MATTLVQSKLVTLTGPRTVIEVVPDTPLTRGNLVAIIIDVRDPTGDASADWTPTPVAPLPDINGFAGLGIVAPSRSTTRSVHISYGPAQPINGYVSFEGGGAGLSEDAEIHVALYEFHSLLGATLGYPMIEYTASTAVETVTQHVDPWFAAATGYAKPGPIVAIGFVPADAETATVTAESGLTLTEVEAPPSFTLSYGERSLGTGDNFSIQGPGSPNADLDQNSGVIYIQDVVPQSRYVTVQEKQVAAEVVALDTPATLGNLIVMSARSTAPIFSDPSAIPDYIAVSQQTVAVQGGGTIYNTLAYGEVSVDLLAATDGGVNFAQPGATDLNIREISGFERAPLLLKQAKDDFFGFEGLDGDGANTTMPISVPDNDAYFFASVALTEQADMGFLLPDLTIQANTRHMAAGDGWDFYPDGGFPVGVVGVAVVGDTSITTAAVIGALFVDDPDVTPDDPGPDPEPVEDTTSYTFPDAADRLYYSPGTRRGSAFTSAKGTEVYVHSDANGSTLAVITDLDGDTITGSKLVVDENSLLPLFKGAPGVHTLWIREAGSTVCTPIHASTTERLDWLANNGTGGGSDDLVIVPSTVGVLDPASMAEVITQTFNMLGMPGEVTEGTISGLGSLAEILAFESPTTVKSAIRNIAKFFLGIAFGNAENGVKLALLNGVPANLESLQGSVNGHTATLETLSAAVTALQDAGNLEEIVATLVAAGFADLPAGLVQPTADHVGTLFLSNGDEIPFNALSVRVVPNDTIAYPLIFANPGFGRQARFTLNIFGEGPVDWAGSSPPVRDWGSGSRNYPVSVVGTNNGSPVVLVGLPF